jgi:hypothetical protein
MTQTLAERIIDCLNEFGPMTLLELVEELGATRSHVSCKLTLMKTANRTHVADWRRDSDGGRLYVRALWAAGPAPGPTPKKPKPLGDSVYGRRYRERRRVAVNSVWSLATPTHDRRLGGVTQ